MGRDPGIERPKRRIPPRPAVENLHRHLPPRPGLPDYAASEFGAVLSRTDISGADAAVSKWQADVVNPLRGVRRALEHRRARGEWAPAAPTESLRRKVAEIELESERIQIDMLDRWCRAALGEWPKADRRAAAVNNCRSLLSHYGADIQADWPTRTSESALALVGS